MTQQAETLALLRRGPVTTADFAATHLSCEYRKWISLLRKDLRKRGGDVRADRLTKSCWVYTLVEPPRVEANGQRVRAG